MLVPAFALFVLVLASPATDEPPAAAKSKAVRARAAELKEPTIAEVQERALAFAQLGAGRIDGLRAGAALRALLPVLEVSGGYSQSALDESTVLDEYSATTPWVIRGAGGTATEARVKLSWDLSRIAYNGEELDVLQLVPMQDRVVERATEIYFRRKRLRAEIATLPPDSPVRREKEIALEEATALLSGLTGGWFGAPKP